MTEQLQPWPRRL